MQTLPGQASMTSKRECHKDSAEEAQVPTTFQMPSKHRTVLRRQIMGGPKVVQSDQEDPEEVPARD